MAKLKVYRTPAGFDDAYVAAASQKAALAAWGADADLFARGIAELVTDADLAREPLAHPGRVIRRPRGTAAEHLKALGRVQAPARRRARQERDGAARDGAEEAGRKSAATLAPEDGAGGGKRPVASQGERPAMRRRARPRPSRAALDRAEQAIAEAERAQARALEDLAARKRAMERDEKETKARFAATLDRLEKARAREQARLASRIEAWAARGD